MGREFSGRTEYVTPDNSETEIAWAVYEGPGNLGFMNRKPIAWFKNHADAIVFIKAAQAALASKEGDK